MKIKKYYHFIQFSSTLFRQCFTENVVVEFEKIFQKLNEIVVPHKIRVRVLSPGYPEILPDFSLNIL